MYKNNFLRFFLFSCFIIFITFSLKFPGEAQEVAKTEDVAPTSTLFPETTEEIPLVATEIPPTPTPTPISWIYVTGDDFEQSATSPFQIDNTWLYVQLALTQVIQPGSTSTLSFSSYDLKDVALNVDALLSNGAVNFVLRDSASGEYRIHLSSQGVLALYSNNIMVASTRIIGISSTSWQRMRVEIVDNTVQVLINGNLALNYTDNAIISAGTVSIYKCCPTG